MPISTPIDTFNNTAVAPPDFEPFWHNTLEALALVPPRTEMQLQARRSGICHHSLSFDSFNHARIHGYLLKWDDTSSRPLVIYTHGYNGQCDVVWQWAEQGFNVLGIDTRGFGRSAIDISKYGWILTGIESATSSILRGAVCDYVRAAQLAPSLLNALPSRTIFYGYSFGGAMALMAEAVSPTADLVAAGVPSFGWMEGRRKLVKLGSGAQVNQYLKKYPEQDGLVMSTLSYFDTVNFAQLIRKPTLIGYGRKDVVVPAETVIAVSDALSCEHKLREFPYSHSEQPEEVLWGEFEHEWQQMLITGKLL